MPVGIKILAANLAMMLLTLAIGLYALQGEQALATAATRIYDDVFMPMNFARSAQARFERVQAIYAVANARAEKPNEAALRKELAAVADDLDVVVERAMAEETRVASRTLNGMLKDLPNTGGSREAAKIATAFEGLAENLAQDGYEFRVEAERQLASYRQWLQGALAVSVALGLAFTLLLARSIVPALRRAAAVARSVAAGQLQTAIVVPRRVGLSETNALLVALARMQEQIRRSLGEADSRAAEKLAEKEIAAKRAVELDSLIVHFREMFSASTDGVLRSSVELENTAQSMSAVADETRGRALAIAGTLDHTSQRVKQSAEATKEMTDTIATIAQQVARSAEITVIAVAHARQTDSVVRTLSDDMRRIGDVVTLIHQIASRTKLLALNATIEAARAGASGKGFAVVAAEVKSLAQQAGNAAEQIVSKVNAVQATTTDMVRAIDTITSTVEELGEISVGIATAVAEQNATTGCIAANVDETAQHTRQVTHTIAEVTEAAMRTGHEAERVLGAAEALSHQARQLTGEFSDFTAAIRAA